MNVIQLIYHSNNLSFILLQFHSVIGILYAFHYKYSKELVLKNLLDRDMPINI